MIGRLTLHLGVLHLVCLFSTSFAVEPLVIAELEVKRSIAEAEVGRATAEHDLAAWRLSQLVVLESRGHAAWQEIAEQEVIVKVAAAEALASKQHLKNVLAWQSRVATIKLEQLGTEFESIKLYVPQTARLVAWIPTESASLELSQRHLEILRDEHQSLSAIDLQPLESAINKAERAVEVYSDRENEADLLSRAGIQLRLAKAKFESAKARKKLAEITSRRMELVGNAVRRNQSENHKSSNVLAQPGTRFVDSSCDGQLARLVEMMATDQSVATGHVSLLQHRQQALVDRINSLNELREYSADHSGELERVKRQSADLRLQIEQARDVLEFQNTIASAYQQTPSDIPAGERNRSGPTDPDRTIDASAAVIRHCLKLQRLKLQTMANRTAIQAHGDYLTERLKRVQQIPEAARPTKELENLRYQVLGVQQQLSVIDRELNMLELEQERFRLQVASQRDDPYRLVQAGDGTFIEREHFEQAGKLLALIGFVGQLDAFVYAPTAHSYIESRVTHDCIRRLSFQPPVSSMDILHRIGWRPIDCFRLRTRLSLTVRPHVSSRSRSAVDGITPFDDRFCDARYGLRRTHRDFRSLPYDYWRTSVECGFRSYYPYGRYSFGLSRPSHFSYLNRFPPTESSLYRSGFAYRSSLPTRNSLYSSPFSHPADSY